MTLNTLAPNDILRRIQPSHMYYRQPNGWITAGAASVIDRARFQQRGWTPLLQYPAFDIANLWGAENPLVTLFQFGGAHELPLDQVIENGFHINPPLVPTCGLPYMEKHNHTLACYEGAKPVHFPQLEGKEFPPAPCRFCERILATSKARDQHEQVMHKDERSDIRTGQTLAESLIVGLKPREPDLEEDELIKQAGLTKKQLEVLYKAGVLTRPRKNIKDEDYEANES